MTNYTPDYWQVIRISSPEEGPIYKVFATWVGGYIHGESWKLNSGITEVRFTEPPYIEFVGWSGSVYNVVNDDSCYRTTAYSGSVLASMIEKSPYEIQVLPFDTNWKELIK
jgi:hypothetical protein